MPPNTDQPRVLVVDTSSLLHAIDLGGRPGDHLGELEALLAIRDAARLEGGLTVAVPEVVVTEYHQRLDGVLKNLGDHLVNTKRKVRRAHSVAHLLGLRPIAADDWDWEVQVGLAAAREVAGFLDTATLHPSTDEDHRRASARAAAYRAPVVRGSSPRDALITEVAIRVAREVAGNAAVIFLSHNTNDFCLDGQLHPHLVPEFDEVGLAYARSWRQVRWQALPE